MSSEIRIDDQPCDLNGTPQLRPGFDAAALADQAQQCALGSEVVLVAFEVFRKVADTVGKQRDLTFGRTRVGVRLAVLAEKLLLFLSC